MPADVPVRRLETDTGTGRLATLSAGNRLRLSAGPRRRHFI
jgi:hypothetical protein